MSTSLKSRPAVCASLALLLTPLIAGVAGGVAASQTTPKPAKPQALCTFVSSAKDRNDKAAVNFNTDQARTSLDSLRKASKLSLPAELEDAIKQLIPLYELLARNGKSDAFTTLDRYATKECGYKTAEDIEACALVSHGDAEALAATPLEPAQAGDGTCSYAGPVDGPTARVDVYVGDGAKSYLDVDRRLGELVPIADLGDEGYLNPSGDVIYFQKSGIWIVMQVIRLEGEYAQPLEALARKVVAAL